MWNALKLHLIRARPRTKLKEDKTLFTLDYGFPLIEEVVRELGILEQLDLKI